MEFGMAMIVRNGEATIAKALESCRDLCQSLHVVDTGSTDRTVQIAKALGANVVEIEWPGRFDVAVNVSFDLVKEPWTLRMDADEWLLPGAAEILKADAAKGADVYSLIREDLHDDGSISEGRQFRLYRTAAKIRLVGRVHEHFPPGQHFHALDSEARIGHTGFAGGMTPDKLRRNIELLRQEAEEHPDSLYYRIELARTLLQLHDPEGVDQVRVLGDWLIEHQDEDEMPESPVGDLLASALDLVPPAEFESPRTLSLIRIARGWGSRVPAATWGVAQLQLKRKRYREAMDALLDLEHMLTTGDYDRRGGFHRGMLERATYQNLALVAHQLGRQDIARRNYVRWLTLDPTNPQARQNLAALG